jgi:hypothetical protein
MRANIVFFVIALLLAAILIPAIAGTWYIIAGERNIPSPSASIGLAILATALGGVTLWFVRRLLDDGGAEPARRRLLENLEYSGRLFVFSAFCFAVFGLLAPVIPTQTTDLAPLEIVTKYVAYATLILGTCSITAAICFGMVLIWFRRL